MFLRIVKFDDNSSTSVHNPSPNRDSLPIPICSTFQATFAPSTRTVCCSVRPPSLSVEPALESPSAVEQRPHAQSASMPPNIVRVQRDKASGAVPGRVVAPKSFVRRAYEALTDAEHASAVRSVVMFGVSATAARDDG
jgi:hypothetical protein